nr:PAS domain-containing protein [Bacteroidota bacterium]
MENINLISYGNEKDFCSAVKNLGYNTEALFQGHSEVIEMIAQSKPLSEILLAIANWIDKHFQGNFLASVLLTDSLGEKLLHGASPGLPYEYNVAVDGLPIGPNMGSCGTAAFLKRTIQVDDIENNPLWDNYKSFALSFGLKSSWAAPIINKEGDVKGVIGIYSKEYGKKPRDEDFQFINFVSSIALVAIENFDKKNELILKYNVQNGPIENIIKERQQFHKILKNLPALIAVLHGPEHVFEYANPHFINLLAPQREIIGKSVLEAFPELQGQEIMELLDEIYHTGKQKRREEFPVYIDKNKNGSLSCINLNFSYHPIRRSKNETGIFIHMVDVTEFVAARKKAEQSEANFKNLIMEAPIATALYVNPGMTIKLANDAMLEIWGRDKSVIGKPLSEALPELKGQPFLELLNNVYATGKAYHTEEQSAELLINGQLKKSWFSFTYKPIFCESGNVINILHMAIDITSKVESIEKLKEATNQLNFVIEAGDFGTWDFNLQTEEFTIDKRCAEMYGLSNIEKIHKDELFKFINPTDVEKIIASLSYIMNPANRGNYDIEFQIIRKEDKKQCWIRAKGKLLFDDENNPVKFSGTSQDITNYKELQQQKDEFLAIASHELK